MSLQEALIASRLILPDTPQASQDDETQIAPVEDLSYDPSYSEYSTPIINILVGLTKVTFSVHQGILCKSSVFGQACERLQNYNALPLPDVEPKYFEIVVRFLYTGKYENFRVPKQGHEDDLIAGFKIHAELYCLARKYKLNDLALLIAAKMSMDDKISFKSLVEIAKVILPKLDHDDVLFSAYFKTEASRAIIEYPRLAEEPWILDIYHNGGRLAVDLFQTFVLNLTNKGSVNQKSKTDPKITTDSGQCKDRASHLKFLKQKGRWGDCRKCNSEWDQMITSVNTIVSVAINDFLPTTYPDVDLKPKAKLSARRIAKAQKEQLNSVMQDILPKTRIPPDAIPNEESSGRCPDQAEHLYREGNRWRWEDCTWCLKDRAQIFEKLQESDSGGHLKSLAELKREWQQTKTHLSDTHAIPEIPEPFVVYEEVVPPMLSFPAIDIPNNKSSESKLCPENENTLPPTDNAPDYQADQPETLPPDAIINFDGPYESLAPNPVNAVTLSSQADGAANCDLGESFQKAEEIPKEEVAQMNKAKNRKKAQEELMIPEIQPVIPEGLKKDKKSKKGKKIETEEKAVLIEEPAIHPVEDNSPENGQFMVDQAVPMQPPVEEVVDLQGWGDFSTKKKVKKGTKDKKKAIEMENPLLTDEYGAMFSNPAPSPPIKSKKGIKGKLPKKAKSATEVVTEDLLFVDPAYPETCTSRSIHLKDEEKWSNCHLCREEVKKIALDLTKEQDALDMGI